MTNPTEEEIEAGAKAISRKQHPGSKWVDWHPEACADFRAVARAALIAAASLKARA